MRAWFAPPRRRGAKSWSEPPFWALDALRLPLLSASLPGREMIENDFEGYVQGAYKTNGIVFACVRARQVLFAQARFQWTRFRDGRPGPTFGTAELALLERPWANGTTVDLLSRMEVDVSLAGNCYLTVGDDAGNLGRAAKGSNRRIVHLRPDWVTIVFGSKSGNPNDADAHVVAYLYQPRATGQHPGTRVTLLPDEVCHYAPYPDPAARIRGQSWLTPVLREIGADKATTQHKAKFFENGAMPGVIIKFDKDVSSDAFDEFVEKFRRSHEGAENAYRTLALSPGADPVVVGANLQQLDFRNTQAAGETRIATSAGVHPVILGLSEGLDGSSLNSGNFGAAKRLFVETTLEHLWLSVASSLQTLVRPPATAPDAVLRHDIRDVPFVREDASDLAQIQQLQATVLRTLADGGWKPDAGVQWLISADLSALLGQHTGLLSVQLQEPGAVTPQQQDRATPAEGG